MKTSTLMWVATASTAETKKERTYAVSQLSCVATVGSLRPEDKIVTIEGAAGWAGKPRE